MLAMVAPSMPFSAISSSAAAKIFNFVRGMRLLFSPLARTRPCPKSLMGPDRGFPAGAAPPLIPMFFFLGNLTPFPAVIQAPPEREKDMVSEKLRESQSITKVGRSPPRSLGDGRPPGHVSEKGELVRILPHDRVKFIGFFLKNFRKYIIKQQKILLFQHNNKKMTKY